MAWIKKISARKPLANDTPSPSVSNYTADGGLRFNFHIGLHKVSLSHMERDMVIAKWAEQEKEFE